MPINTLKWFYKFRLAFGYKSSPRYFLANNGLDDAVAYIDDIFIKSATKNTALKTDSASISDTA